MLSVLQTDKSRVFAKCCDISRSLCPVAATVRLGHLMFQTKRWNEATRMADQKGQSPSLAITMRVLFGRTTSRRLGFEARRTSPLRSDFEGGRGGDPSPDSRRYRYAALRAFSRTCPRSLR
jgi:hypothetical protein